MKIEQKFAKEDTTLFCYYCWYYLTVRTNITNDQTIYRVAVIPSPDGGEDTPAINVGGWSQVGLPSSGMSVQRKFILDSKEPFNLTMKVNTGQVNMYVTLSPGASQKSIWTKNCTAGKTCTLKVRTTDQNFHVGAFYYVILQSAMGKLDMILYLNQ
jgi:hypothetical protein